MLSAVFFCGRQKAGAILPDRIVPRSRKTLLDACHIPQNGIPAKYTTNFVVYSLKATKLVAYREWLFAEVEEPGSRRKFSWRRPQRPWSRGFEAQAVCIIGAGILAGCSVRLPLNPELPGRFERLRRRLPTARLRRLSLKPEEEKDEAEVPQQEARKKDEVARHKQRVDDAGNPCGLYRHGSGKAGDGGCSQERRG